METVIEESRKERKNRIHKMIEYIKKDNEQTSE